MDAIVNAAKRALLGGGVKPAERSSACGAATGRRAPGKEGTPLAATVTVVLGADPGKGNDGRRG